MQAKDLYMENFFKKNMCLPEFMHTGQRRLAFRSLASPSTTWAQGVKLSLSGFPKTPRVFILSVFEGICGSLDWQARCFLGPHVTLVG